MKVNKTEPMSQRCSRYKSCSDNRERKIQNPMTCMQAITREGSGEKWHSRRQQSVQRSCSQTKWRDERMGEGKEIKDKQDKG